MVNIEELKKETRKIEDDLKALKNNVTLSEEERKNQAEELKNRAETTKKKIENEIHSLESKTDVESKKKKEEAETLLNSFNEIMNLYNSILNNGRTIVVSVETPAKAIQENTSEQKEEKGFFGKIGEGLGNMWGDVTSGDKWKEQPGKNLLYVAGVGLTGYAVYKGAKALWNWAFGDNDDKEEGDETKDEETESKSKKKKKSFWKTTTGKVLKWLGIGTAAGGGIYLFGKWLHLWGDKEKPTDSDRDQVKAEAYDKFAENSENREAVENYETFGENVDTMYEDIYKKELSAGYQDQLTMDRISKEYFGGTKRYLGIVPFCLDNKFGTTDEIMQQNTSMKNALAGGIRDMTAYIKGLGNDFLKMFADSYLSKLPSWAGVVGNSLSDKVDNWIASNEKAEKELQFFFRQSIRIQTYLFEKKDQLIDKIATEKASGLGMSKKELLEDDEKYEEYILKDPQYQAFIGTKISNACNVLKNRGIFDATVGEDVRETVENLDKERKNVVGDDIGGKDILEIVNEKGGNNLDANEKQKLSKSCDNIVKDVDNSIQDAVKASAWNSYGDLFSSDDSALREYWEKSGLNEVFQKYKTKIIAKKAELDAGTLNPEKIKALAESVNNMLALKKEAILGRNCIIRDRDEHGNFILRIPGFLVDSFKNLGTSMSKLVSGEFMDALNYFTSGYIGAGGVLYIALSTLSGNKNALISIPATIGKSVVAAPIKVPLWLIKKFTKNTNMGMRMNNSIKYGTSSWINYRNLFNEASGPEDLMKVFKSGERNLGQTANILKAKLKTSRGTKFREWSDTFGGLEIDDIKNEKYLREKVFDKLLDDYFQRDLESLRNIKNNPELYEKLLEHYDTSPVIRKAIKSGRIDKVKTAVTNLHSTIEGVGEVADTAARRAFNASIDKVIAKLNEVANPSAVSHHIEQLKALKNDTELVDDEMECFVKFIDEGFDAKLIPELKKLINISDTFRGGEKIGDELKKMLSAGKYEEFRSIIRKSELSNVFNKFNVDDVLKNFDKVLLKGGKAFGDETARLLKSFFKVLVKVL